MILNINNLSKYYDRNKVLDDLNIKIKQGEIYGLLGANGAGKTTTINIICGLLNHCSGTILIDGEKVNQKTKYKLGIATQENLLYTQLTCEENLRFFGQLYGLKGTKLTSSVYRCLDEVKLTGYNDTIVENLSGGMQRRLNMAIALIHTPKLLILDEPTTGLDIEIRYEIWQLILRLKQEGMTILLTTHLLDEAEKLCDRIGILKAGRIIQEGNLAQLKTLIPAQELVFIETDNEEKAILQGEKLDLSYRYYQKELAFLMPQERDLTDIIRSFAGLNLISIRKEKINLQHIYLEAIRS